MTELHRFERRLGAAWPVELWRDLTVLVAVSGGADSVALVRALAVLQQGGAGRLVVGHFNHRLRGAEADVDERFVGELATKLGLQSEIGRAERPVDPDASRRGEGLEAAARDDRYSFLKTTAERLGARYVVTAHTADDQVETILQRVVRGTGLAGLAGMKRVRRLGVGVTLIRPLLEFRRQELAEYLKGLDQSSREDTTNADLGFTRNRIRRDLLPRLEGEYNAAVSDAILRLGGLASEAQQMIDSLTDPLHVKAVKRSEPKLVQVDCSVLADTPFYLVRELLIALWRKQGWPEQAMSFARWEELADMVAEHPPEIRRTLPGKVEARREGDLLTLRRV